jgi:GH15 family glucan-1,4-alpha-glucosidase
VIGEGSAASQLAIADFAFLSDCHGSALVGRDGSVDWCCMPRFDAPSCFGRILDSERGGHCALAPSVPHSSRRAYLDGTLVLVTTFETETGEARLTDAFAMRPGGREQPLRLLMRVVDGLRGEVPFGLEIVPRFDYGDILPWLRGGGMVATAVGGSSGLLIECDQPMRRRGDHDLVAAFRVRAGERVRLRLRFFPPERIDEVHEWRTSAEETDRVLDATAAWWRSWSERGRAEGPEAAAIHRSAAVLKGLNYAPTGAIIAAPTTSLPEQLGGPRNWDYRFSWIRDSTFTARSLAQIGHDGESAGFRRFIQRSAAGSALDLQIMYGVGGERRLTEVELAGLAGYRGSRPVRIGNAAADQLQLDMYGELVTLAWQDHQRGHPIAEDYWPFLVSLVNAAAERAEQADRGLWEIRGAPRHFVHSKAMCWAALDRGAALARSLALPAPVGRWAAKAAEIRRGIETRGFDSSRGVFTQAYDHPALDAALLLLPAFGFVAYDDPRMVRTADAIRDELDAGGLIRRYIPETGVDGLPGDEGAFIACTFWLAECLARQGRVAEARTAFRHAAATCNDLGLFAEEWDPGSREMLGNFPQGLTHLSHMAAAVALSEAEG